MNEEEEAHAQAIDTFRQLTQRAPLKELRAWVRALPDGRLIWLGLLGTRRLRKLADAEWDRRKEETQ
jgi:hypothetical protein